MACVIASFPNQICYNTILANTQLSGIDKYIRFGYHKIKDNHFGVC